MDITERVLNGAYVLTLPRFDDERGFFMKTFNADAMAKQGIDFTLKESYCSLSHKDVIRGMHFQTPPHQHSKIVFCPQGSLLDVVVDLRKNSDTYGCYHAAVLSAENNRAFYIPEGFAHGFAALEDHTLTYYLVSSTYHKESDTGIHYDSFGMDWGIGQPIVSQRDKGFIKLADWESVF